MTPEEIDKYRYKSGISPAEYEWRELKGLAYLPKSIWCMNCKSEVILLDYVTGRDACPNDECYNFAPGIDFWLTGEEWLRNDDI